MRNSIAIVIIRQKISKLSVDHEIAYLVLFKLQKLDLDHQNLWALTKESLHIGFSRKRQFCPVTLKLQIWWYSDINNLVVIVKTSCRVYTSIFL